MSRQPFFAHVFQGAVRERLRANPTQKKVEVENRMHAQNGLLTWLAEQE